MTQPARRQTSYVRTLRPRRPVAGVELIFAPTRTRIIEAGVTWPGKPAGRKVAVTRGTGPYVAFDWGAPPVSGPIEVSLAAVGERLQRPRHEWLGKAFIAADQCHPMWKAVFDGRQWLSRTCGVQAFFHELEQRTAGPILQCRDDLDAIARDRRIGLVDSLLGRLEQRVYQRWLVRGTPGRDPGVDPLAKVEVEEITAEFLAAAAALCGDLDLVAEAFVKFAAGWARQEFTGHGRRREIVCEPNSWYIFMFAELALDAAFVHGVEPDFWKALLPTLVKIQEIYVARHKKGVAYVVDYDMCRRPLSLVRVTAIDKAYAGIDPSDRAALEERIRGTLKLMGCTDFYRPQTEPVVL